MHLNCRVTVIIFSNENEINFLTKLELKSAFIFLNSNNLIIGSDVKIRAEMSLELVLQTNDNFCGVKGANSATLGGLHDRNNHVTCFHNYLQTHYEIFLESQEHFLVVSEKIKYITDSSVVIKKVKEAGGVVILASKIAEISGYIGAEGSDSESVDNINIGASGGGSVLFNIENLKFTKEVKVSVKGGKGSTYCGFGGNGKVILNFNQINLMEKNISTFFDLGENNLPIFEKLSLPNFYVRFLIDNREFFIGKIVSKKECCPGQFGILCQTCPAGTYQPYYGKQTCNTCPCFVDKSKWDEKILATSFNQCHCINTQQRKQYSLLITLLVSMFLAVVFYRIGFYRSNSSKYERAFSFTIDDIPSTFLIIYCRGSNNISNPFVVGDEGHIVVNNWNEFKEEFNRRATWNWKNKLMMTFSYIFFFSPFYLYLKTFLRSSKVSGLKALIKNFEWSFNTQQLIAKCHVSYNSSHFQLIFLSPDKVTKIHTFMIQFPRIIRILGNGTFENEFKIDYSDPNVQLVIKNLKRQIYKSDITHLKIPKILLKITKKVPVNSVNPTIDYIFSYLSLLISTIIINLPFFKMRERFQRLTEFMSSVNLFLRDFGYRIDLVFEFTYRKKTFEINANGLASKQQAVLKRYYFLFQNQAVFNFQKKFLISNIERKLPISNFFGLGQKTEEPINHINAFEAQDQKMELRMLFEAHIKIKKTAYLAMIRMYLGDIELKLKKIFWKLVTFHHCRVFSMSSKFILVFLFGLLLLSNYLSHTESSNLFSLELSTFLFPAIHWIHLGCFGLYVVFNKKKLLKTVIYGSIMNIIKNTLIGVYLLVMSKEFMDTLLYQFLIEGFLHFTICYLGCFVISFEHFMKCFKNVAKMN